MKAYWGVEMWLHASLTSALDGGELSPSRPGLFTPRERSPWYPLNRSLGGPRSRSGRGGEEKHFQPLPGLEHLIIQPVAQHDTTEISRLLYAYSQVVSLLVMYVVK
jgi:hypothetical protein